MKALGYREAKWNIALYRAGGIQSRNRRGKNRCCFAGTLAWRQQFGRSKFDGHFGIH